jgi:hypothetical protein
MGSGTPPWRLGQVLGHLLGNLRTCGGRRLPPGASPRVGGSLMNGWMWRPAEAEAINRRAPRAKGARTEPKTGQVGLDPVRSSSAPSRSPMLLGRLLTCSLMHVGP